MAQFPCSTNTRNPKQFYYLKPPWRESLGTSAVQLWPYWQIPGEASGWRNMAFSGINRETRQAVKKKKEQSFRSEGESWSTVSEELSAWTWPLLLGRNFPRSCSSRSPGGVLRAWRSPFELWDVDPGFKSLKSGCHLGNEEHAVWSLLRKFKAVSAFSDSRSEGWKKTGNNTLESCSQMFEESRRISGSSPVTGT